MRHLVALLLLLTACEAEARIRRAPEPRPTAIGDDAVRCLMGGHYVRPRVGQKRCDLYRCDTAWSPSGVVVLDRAERQAFECRKSSPVPQNGAR